MKKSSLFISFDGLSDPLGQSQILPYLCGIAKNGYNITILSCEKKNRLLNENTRIRLTIEGLPIEWKYIEYKENGGFLLRIIYIFRLRKLAKKECRLKEIKLVHCRSYLAALIGLHLKVTLNIPFLFDMRGFWADERIDGGIWSMRNLIHRTAFNFFKNKEKQFLDKSDAIVSLTNKGIEALDKKFQAFHLLNKTTVIPCCTNTDLFKYNSKSLAFQGLNLKPENFVIIYTGSIGTWYYTKEMIDCMLVWKKFIPQLKFLILTKDQTELSNILSLYNKEEQSLVITKSVSYNEVVDYLSIAKAALFFIMPSFSKIASSPTKMAECWSIGLPIISNKGIGDNDLYFNQHKGGVLLSEFNAKAYEKAYLEFKTLNLLPEHYRQIALDYFDHQMAIQKYTAIYDKLSA